MLGRNHWLVTIPQAEVQPSVSLRQSRHAPVVLARASNSMHLAPGPWTSKTATTLSAFFRAGCIMPALLHGSEVGEGEGGGESTMLNASSTTLPWYCV